MDSMAYNRLSNETYWKRGPVRLAELRDELKTYEAMGNKAAATLTRHEIEALEQYIAASDEIHKPQKRTIGFLAHSDKIDTQGR